MNDTFGPRLSSFVGTRAKASSSYCSSRRASYATPPCLNNRPCIPTNDCILSTRRGALRPARSNTEYHNHRREKKHRPKLVSSTMPPFENNDEDLLSGLYGLTLDDDEEEEPPSPHPVPLTGVFHLSTTLRLFSFRRKIVSVLVPFEFDSSTRIGCDNEQCGHGNVEQDLCKLARWIPGGSRVFLLAFDPSWCPL